jgi:hypothetical protein
LQDIYFTKDTMLATKTSSPKLRRPAATDTPWDICSRQELTRPSSIPGYGRLDPGVNFFVLALEALGAVPRHSCEGHPCGFYVAFDATYELAQEIHAAGFFTVEIERPNYWSIRMREIGTNGPYKDKDRVQCLRWASSAWASAFGERLGDIAKL